MDFQITEAHKHLQQRCHQLAEDFATRAAAHDRDATNPVENYAALRREGFYALNVPKELGGWGVGLLGYSLAAEELAQGCPATALSFNMHLSIVGPLMESPEVSPATKQQIADLVVKEQKLIAGNFSEPHTSGLLATYAPATRARRVAGGYHLNGRKAFASMLEAADYCAVLAHPEEAPSPAAAVLLLVPRQAPGRRVEQVWDTLGMRATCSDSLILEDCWVPEDAALFEAEDILPFIRSGANWLWASYTAVYLGVGVAAYKEVIKVLKDRIPRGYSQPLAYHPDVRRRVAEMSADLEAARLLTYHSAWLSDTEGPTSATTAALFRAKYLVGEAVTRITRTALTLGGAHALFKTSPLERLFRDGAVAPIQFPPSDFCLSTMGMLELGLDPREVLPPLKQG
ncbi:MAG: acyl-CoA/acyl-ACP dehydrogenase [Deltaproteobacteria bacterium]|nr:acyl-CoA/acyl-ACP dehydrogenase [Deltaproteobacteria bacterium]